MKHIRTLLVIVLLSSCVVKKKTSKFASPTPHKGTTVCAWEKNQTTRAYDH